MKLPLALSSVLVLALAGAASADYTGWNHSGSVYVLTTSEGADLPASAAVENFPLLVRLHKDFFDFAQAKANGEDLRFSSATGDPLPYQIEEWDAAEGRREHLGARPEDHRQHAAGDSNCTGARPTRRASPTARPCSTSRTATSACGT